MDTDLNLRDRSPQLFYSTVGEACMQGTRRVTEIWLGIGRTSLLVRD